MAKVGSFSLSTPCREPVVPMSLFRSPRSKLIDRLIPLAACGVVGCVLNYFFSSACSAYQDIYYNQMKCDKEFKPLGCIPTGASMVTNCAGATVTGAGTLVSGVGTVVSAIEYVFDVDRSANLGLKKGFSDAFRPDNWDRPDNHEVMDFPEFDNFRADEKLDLMDLWMKNNPGMGE